MAISNSKRRACVFLDTSYVTTLQRDTDIFHRPKLEKVRTGLSVKHDDQFAFHVL